MYKKIHSEEQEIYGTILMKGVVTSLSVLCLAFMAYFISLLTAYISYESFVNNWSLPMHEYHKAVGLEIGTGWAWVSQLTYPDLASLVTVMYLSSITLICYLKILPIFFKRKDKIYFILTMAEIVVLCVAASGILKAGG